MNGGRLRAGRQPNRSLLLRKSASGSIIRSSSALQISLSRFWGLYFSLSCSPFIALAIKLDLPGPVAFSQTRIGRHMKPSRCTSSEPCSKNAEDLLTSFLRTVLTPSSSGKTTRASPGWALFAPPEFDEFPQFLNILKGERSFIGPRPFVESEVEQLDREDSGATASVPD